MSNFLAEHSKCIAKGYVHGMLYNVSWFPGVVLSNTLGDARVYGSIFKIEATENVLQVLDAYEGADFKDATQCLFLRQLVKVYVAKEARYYTAWIYVYNKSVKGLERIISGDFLKYNAS